MSIMLNVILYLFCAYRKPQGYPWMNANSKITAEAVCNFGQRFSAVTVSPKGMPVGIYLPAKFESNLFWWFGR